MNIHTLCIAGENEFNSSTNISTTFQRSGSINVSGSDSWRFFPPEMQQINQALTNIHYDKQRDMNHSQHILSFNLMLLK